MYIFYFIGIIMGAMSVSFASKSTFSHFRGWYPCSEYTLSDEGSSSEDAECAVYRAPLCYPGICETPNVVHPRVDIFVKRLSATRDPETASNVWLLEGGPGYSSIKLEPELVTLHTQLEGAVNVYTMDHRGTGRSTMFDCVRAQATSTRSPAGGQIDTTEVATCAKELEMKYGDLASFSVTTAATDLATFISKYTNGRSTIVYGVSYGTVLVERLMHLSPPEVVGYVLDGIATTSGAPSDRFFYVSNGDTNFGEVGDAFLRLCEKDKLCKTRFASKGLNKSLRTLLQQFDDNPNSACAALVNSTLGLDSPSPSFGLRSVLGSALADSNVRTLIPPVVYRLLRCSPEDIGVLTQFLSNIVPNAENTVLDREFSILLYGLIVYSEMWESPLPSMSEMESRFTDMKMSSGDGLYGMGPQYCAFSKEKSKSCDEFSVGAYDANGIVYKRDKYWNKTATIPNQASVLLLNGKLDPQTPHKYAEALLAALNGKNKELITFDYASHGTIVTTQMVAGDPWSESCGMRLLASYVQNDGDLKRLDKSCLKKMPTFNLITPDVYLTTYFGTEDAYDGVFNSSLLSN